MREFQLNFIPESEGKSIADLARHYEEEVERYKEYIATFNGDVEKLKEEEKYPIELLDKYEKEMAEFKGYKMPAEITFDGQPLTKANIAKKIRDIFDNLEVGFSMTLGYYETYKFWKSPKSTIPHNVFDSTLKILGNNLKFKGSKEWFDILAIDSYFKEFIYAYQNRTIYLILYSQLHSVVLDAMKLNEPAPEE